MKLIFESQETVSFDYLLMSQCNVNCVSNLSAMKSILENLESLKNGHFDFSILKNCSFSIF